MSLPIPPEIASRVERVSAALEGLYPSESAASEALGLPYTTLRRALRPEENPVTNSATWSKRLDQIELALERATAQSNGTAPELADSATSADESDLVTIPEIQIEASAGEFGTDPNGYALEVIDGETRLPGWYIRHEYGVEPHRVRQIRVRGNSMEPTLQPGQRLLVALWNGAMIQDGLIYVIYASGLLIKRLFLEEDTDGRRYVRVYSDNADVQPPYRIAAERFEQDYRVIAVALEVNRKL